MISATGLLSIVFSGSLLIFLIWSFLRKDMWLAYTGPRVVIWVLMIVMIRMLIPFEIGFETSIYLEWGLPAFRDFLLTPIVFPIITISPGEILVTIWITGAVICFSRSLFSFLLLKRAILRMAFPCPAEAEMVLDELCQKRSGRTAAFRLVCSPLIKTPMLIGCRCPIIVIPDLELSSKEWSYILRHEMAHHDNHDLWVKIFCEFVCAVYWWNPISSLLRFQFEKVLELHADEVVTQYMDGWETNDYMQCLVNVARASANLHPSRYAVAFTTSEQFSLKQRFRLLAENTQQAKEARQRHLVPSMLMSAALLIGVFSFILEPEYPLPDSYSLLDPDNAYLVLNGNGSYDIYVDEKYFATVLSLRHSFSDLTIYNSLEEVNKYETS